MKATRPKIKVASPRTAAIVITVPDELRSQGVTYREALERAGQHVTPHAPPGHRPGHDKDDDQPIRNPIKKISKLISNFVVVQERCICFFYPQQALGKNRN